MKNNKDHQIRKYIFQQNLASSKTKIMNIIDDSRLRPTVQKSSKRPREHEDTTQQQTQIIRIIKSLLFFFQIGCFLEEKIQEI